MLYDINICYIYISLKFTKLFQINYSIKLSLQPFEAGVLCPVDKWEDKTILNRLICLLANTG